MFSQIVQFHKFERRYVRGGEHDPRRATRLEGLLPARDAEAPLISRFQAGKAEVKGGRREIISRRLRKREKLRVYPHADRVETVVPRARMAAAIPEKTRRRTVTVSKLDSSPDSIFFLNWLSIVWMLAFLLAPGFGQIPPSCLKTTSARL